jgi:hypothetical protein
MEKGESKKVVVKKEIKKVMVASLEKNEMLCMMNFHVTDATRILASADKLNEAGNDVHLSAIPDGRYIRSRTSGQKARLKREDGVFVLEVMVINGGVATPAKIIVDSGAAENVMPQKLMRGVPMKEKKAGVRFMAANGEEMANYGQKDLQFIPKEFWDKSGFAGRP